MTMAENWITTEDAAKMLLISTRTLGARYKLICKKNGIRVSKPAGKLMFSLEDIQKAIEASEVKL